MKKVIPKNLYTKTLIAIIIVFIILLAINPIRKLITYGTDNVFEDNSLGYYLHEYENADQLKITTLQPEDIEVQEFTYEKVRNKKYESIVNWSLKSDEYFEGLTDVLGICRYHFYVYPNAEVESAIEIDHQGGACAFWENINPGDTIEVIGEITTSKPVWTETGKLKRYATEYLIEIKPMIIKHKDNIYLDISLPASIRMKLLQVI